MADLKEFPHFKEVTKRFENQLILLETAYNHSQVSEIEREGTQLMRELQIVAPRLWNDFINVAHEQRRKISRGEILPPAPVEEKKPKKKTTKKGK